MHDCNHEILEILNKLRAKSADRMAKDQNGKSEVFWQEVSYMDALKAAIDVVKGHTDCTA